MSIKFTTYKTHTHTHSHSHYTLHSNLWRRRRVQFRAACAPLSCDRRSDPSRHVCVVTCVYASTIHYKYTKFSAHLAQSILNNYTRITWIPQPPGRTAFWFAAENGSLRAGMWDVPLAVSACCNLQSPNPGQRAQIPIWSALLLLAICCSCVVTPIAARAVVWPQPTSRLVAVERSPLVAPVHSDAAHHSRSRRTIVFRPLFVYKQREVKKMRLQNEKVSRA